MKFSIRTPTAGLGRKLAAFRQAVKSERRDVLELVGVRILSFSKQDYVTKSRGGTGTDGIKWKPLAPATIAARNRRGKANAGRKTTRSGKARPAGGTVAIGIDMGLQLSSASPGFKAPGGGNVFVINNQDVTVGYGRSYSRYFDADRKLLPDVMPAAWRKAVEDIVGRWAAKILRRFV